MTVFDSHPRGASGPAACAAELPLPRCRFFPSPRTGSGPNRAQPNRYTNPVNTASAERSHCFSIRTLEYLVSGHYRQAARVTGAADAGEGPDAALMLYLTKADPLLVLRDLLGHSSVLTTEKYLRKLDTTRIYRDAWERSGPGGDRAADDGTEREAAAEFAGGPDGSAG